MANPIKYSTGSETNALKKGNFFFGTGDVGKGPSDVTGYYQGVDVPQPGYVVYQYLESSASNLTYAALNSDSELINFTNGIADESFTSVAQCFTYYATQNDKVCFNRDYEPIVTDGLVLNVDAGFDGSYPASGTTWRDLSVSGNNGTLTNSPGFYANGGGGIVFNGTDNYVDSLSGSVFTDPTTQSVTISVWMFVPSNATWSNGNKGSIFAKGNNEGSFGLVRDTVNNQVQLWIRGITSGSGGPTTTINRDEWVNIVGTWSGTTSSIYKNGVLQNSSTLEIVGGLDTTSYQIGNVMSFSGANGNFFKGSISNVQVYDKILTTTEISQNYNAMKDRFAFIFTVDTTKVGTTSSTQFKLPLVSSGSVNFVVEWGDGTTDTITTFNQVQTTHTYSSEGTYEIKIRGIIRGWQFNNGGDRLKMGVIKNWGCLDISVDSGFYGCTNLTASATDAPTITSTSLSQYFRNCTNFNGQIGNWDTSSVTNMSVMFRDAFSFNQNIGNWNVFKVTNFASMFENATIFNNGGSDDIDNWKLSTTSNISMAFMFGSTISIVTAPKFNRYIGSWNTERVTDMIGMFLNNTAFNQNISTKTINVGLPNQYMAWNVSNVTSMNGMFQNANQFNQPLNWDTSSVTQMRDMFNTASSFNQNIGAWDVSKVTNFSNMFLNATAFNNGGSDDIDNWTFSTISDISMSGMFGGTNTTLSCKFNRYIGSWDTQRVTNMISMFRFNTAFNQDIGSWNILKVSSVERMFSFATSFNQDISNWDVSNISSFFYMFVGAREFNNGGSSSINNWNIKTTGSVDMGFMFGSGNADTPGSGVGTKFNQPIGNWNTSAVTNMTNMFTRIPNFNQDISNWDTSSVTSMRGMFQDSPFNQDIGNWKTSNVTNMGDMFRTCPFNYDISTKMVNEGEPNEYVAWDVSNVTNMLRMFQGNIFNRDISNWDIKNVGNGSSFKTGAFSTVNYDALLIGWSQRQVKSNITFGFGTSKYTPGGAAEAARNVLINTYGWTIIDGGPL
jgi:surface protein